MDSNDFFNPFLNASEDYFDGNEIYFIQHYNEIRPTYPYMYFNEIRLSIFGIVAVCVGLPCLIWAFYSVHLQRKASGRVSAFIILLLLNDLLQLPLYTYIVSELLTSGFYPFPGIIALLAVFLKIVGLHLQALVALESILTLKYPMISAHIFSCPCYIMISIIILLIPVMFVLGLLLHVLFDNMFVYLAFGSFLLPACLLVVTGIIIYKAPPTAAITPVTDPRPGAVVFTVSLVTLLVLYLPCVMLIVVPIHFQISLSWLIITFCLLSLTVISEPLLCVLVCRQNLSAQSKQTRIELNSEQTSV